MRPRVPARPTCHDMCVVRIGASDARLAAPPIATRSGVIAVTATAYAWSFLGERAPTKALPTIPTTTLKIRARTIAHQTVYNRCAHSRPQPHSSCSPSPPSVRAHSASLAHSPPPPLPLHPALSARTRLSAPSPLAPSPAPSPPRHPAPCPPSPSSRPRPSASTTCS